MAKLDIDWLTVFIEVYKTQSVSRAAEQLGIAQARASGILSKLRLHFGDALFARTSCGMEPTRYAQEIYPDILKCVERLSLAAEHRSGFDPATARRNFRVCMTDISEIIVLPALVNRLRRLAPGISITAERISPDSPRRLEAGEADLAVGFIPQLEAGFYQQTLFRQDFVCLAARNHPRVRERPSRQAFMAEGHMLVTTSGTGHTIVERVLARRGIERAIVLKVSGYLGVGRIVAQTELLAIVPRGLGEAIAAQERINIFAPPVSLPAYSVKQHWHERFHADTGNMWLRRALAGLFSG